MKRGNMKENSIYFAENIFYQIIRDVGGAWNDSKERPIVCLLKLDEYTDIYWAIPMGYWEHRDNSAKKRIKNYLSLPENRLQSCFYHIGNTTTKSIFFISDVVPITGKYINREYLGYNSKGYEIKNKKLIAELQRKLKRVLYCEEMKPNFFRQHITDVKNRLIAELEKDKSQEQVAAAEIDINIQN